MNLRLANIILYIVLLVLSIGYLSQAILFLKDSEELFLSPGFLPAILAVLIISLIILSFFQTLKSDEHSKVFKIDNLNYIVITLGITFLYLILWSAIEGSFFILTFLAFSILSNVYSWESRKEISHLIVKNLSVAFAFTLLIYLVFDVIFSIKF